MNDTVESLVKKLLEVIDGDDWFNANGNERELALMDAVNADNHIESLEEKIEDLEWEEDDYFTIDKDDLDIIVTNTMRKMFFNSASGKYISPEEGDYDQWVDDAVYEMKNNMEPFNKEGIVCQK